MIKLTDSEKEIVNRLNDSLYTVDYLEEWINRREDINVDCVAKFFVMLAKGYYLAVRNMAELEGAE